MDTSYIITAIVTTVIFLVVLGIFINSMKDFWGMISEKIGEKKMNRYNKLNKVEVLSESEYTNLVMSGKIKSNINIE